MQQTLTVRGDSVWPWPCDPAAPRIVLLVHGYNNTEQQARESYRELREKIEETGASPATLENIWEVYWHGFEARWVTLLPRDEESTLLSVRTYAAQVPVARAAGRTLGEYLARLPAEIELIFVAHSLGSRVVLEALRVLYRYKNQSPNHQGPSVRAYCLMAAAVPTYMVEPARILRRPAQIAGQSHVLWSPWDWVLRFAFPPGQTQAGEGHLPEAVGHAGQPYEVWTLNHRTNLGHSGYYRKAAQNPYTLHASRDTAPYLAPLFGASIPKPIPEIGIIEWTGPGSQPLPRVTLPRREIGSRLRKWFHLASI